jgi:DNA polymerase-3 subunit alpha
MCALEIEDLHGSAEAVLFPEAFEKYGHMIVNEAIVFLKGKLDLSSDKPKIIVEQVISLKEARSQLSQSLLIQLNETGLGDNLINDLKKILKQHPGNTPVVFEIATLSGKLHRIRAGRHFQVKINEKLTKNINKLLGNDHFRLQPLAKN